MEMEGGIRRGAWRRGWRRRGAASAYTRHQTGVRKPRQMIIHELGSSGPGAVGVGPGALRWDVNPELQFHGTSTCMIIHAVSTANQSEGRKQILFK